VMNPSHRSSAASPSLLVRSSSSPPSTRTPLRQEWHAATHGSPFVSSPLYALLQWRLAEAPVTPMCRRRASTRRQSRGAAEGLRRRGTDGLARQMHSPESRRAVGAPAPAPEQLGFITVRRHSSRRELEKNRVLPMRTGKKVATPCVDEPGVFWSRHMRE
jgi:hypothetical protein